jgi:hypothetical protein
MAEGGSLHGWHEPYESRDSRTVLWAARGATPRADSAAAARTKGTYLAAQYARIKGRHGHNKAVFAVAHSILVIAFHVLQRGEPYNELGGDYFIERQQKNAYQRRLVKQLERMGFEVALTSKAA